MAEPDPPSEIVSRWIFHGSLVIMFAGIVLAVSALFTAEYSSITGLVVFGVGVGVAIVSEFIREPPRERLERLNGHSATDEWEEDNVR